MIERATHDPAQASGGAGLLLIDDEPAILSSLKRLFRPFGYRIVTANSGTQGLALLESQPVDLIICDMRMPEMDGAQFFERTATRWPDVKRILLTGYSDPAATVAAINQGHIWGYVAKPWRDEELEQAVRQALAERRLLQENARLARLAETQNAELKTLNAGLEHKVAERTAALGDALAEAQAAHARLRQGFLATVQLFSGLTELRGGRLAGHARRVADTARRLAERLGIDEAAQQDVLLAALLHDIGKIGLPDRLLNAPYGGLAAGDRAEVMQHPVKGQQFLSGIAQLKNAAQIVRHHHESFNGGGYPDGLEGWAIPLGARILAVANDFDSLQTGVLTLHAHTPGEAVLAIVKERGHRYDPGVVDAFLAWVRDEPPKTIRVMTLPVAQLRPGMALACDFRHPDGRLMMRRGEVLDAQAIVRLTEIEVSLDTELTLGIINELPAAVLRTQADESPACGWKELALSSDRLRPGMRLNRNLYHHEGYLLLARGRRLEESLIKQLREFEQANGETMTIHIRVDTGPGR